MFRNLLLLAQRFNRLAICFVSIPGQLLFVQLYHFISQKFLNPDRIQYGEDGIFRLTLNKLYS